MNRLDYYNLYDVFNKKTKSGAALINAFLKIQKLFGFRRTPLASFPDLYGGSAWWSISRSGVQYVIDQLDQAPEIMVRLKHTHCPEEILFQTVLMNSPYKSSIIGNTMTLVLWEYRNGNSPATLDQSDLPKVLRSKKLFARRFEYPASIELVKLIEKEVFQTSDSLIKSLP